MDWVKGTFGTSIGKKQLMAVTGLGFIGFLTGHLLGNLTIYLGPDAFDSYAEHLHALGPLVNAAEIGLLLFAIIHVGTGLLLFLQNYKARPVKYVGKKWAGGRTIFSATMPYTGILILLFLIIHLKTFHFVDHDSQTISQIVSHAFSSVGYVLFYMFSMIVVAFHVKHGFWSAFQTLGLNHLKYMPTIFVLSALAALAAGFGFGFLPVVSRLVL
ncbi:succinate dehydrogenase cytochrome b subunit [Desulfatibacillum aliphaticivorans]|uniref:Succinate dehydrogenase/fumarate reductase cytochrome b subunit (B558 family) n=1 Tax=Desulfatibacillum aliphaticivorans TaxID=218208 RepID=B8FBU2_DESAL|nr:succinate dehydrogenase cytochrome b subunit [Desulfatibacillum aliphaticivorans]ACL04845.1 Succinate dehydrogenase/fumarate reductase cytochrome b subunit (b558 family) [Desulfatibacillum aliphaticivorans]